MSFGQSVINQTFIGPMLFETIKIRADQTVCLEKFQVVEHCPGIILRRIQTTSPKAVRTPEQRIAELRPCRNPPYCRGMSEVGGVAAMY